MFDAQMPADAVEQFCRRSDCGCGQRHLRNRVKRFAQWQAARPLGPKVCGEEIGLAHQVLDEVGWQANLFFPVADHFAGHCAAIDSREIFFHCRGE